MWYPMSASDMNDFENDYGNYTNQGFLSKTCGRNFWIGLEKVPVGDPEDQKWGLKSLINGQAVNYEKWSPGQPNGRDKTTFVALEVLRGKIICM